LREEAAGYTVRLAQTDRAEVALRTAAAAKTK
jgi:hypothetical protein